MKPLHWSALRYMADCPAAYKHYLEFGITPTPAMRFGSLVHMIVLGKSVKDFTIWEGDRRGKAWEEFKAANQGVEIYTAKELTPANDCADAILNDPVCHGLVTSGIKEQSITWDIDGRPCAGTPDINGDILADLKITPMAAPHRIEWHARKMLWHAQLAWYKHGIEKNGKQIQHTYLITCTPKPPYLPVVYELTQQTLDLGTETWWKLFEQLRVCEASNQFPGYAQAILPLNIESQELSLTIDGEEFEL